MSMLVDSHCHLNFKEFEEDFDAVITRSLEQGVSVLQTICTTLGEFDEVHAVANRHPALFCSVGVHPNNVEQEPDVTAAQILERTRHPKVIGIGETGLDYYYEHSPRELQQRSFREHIMAAREADLPLIIHTRSADDDTAAMLKEALREGAVKGVLHCFSSTRALAEEALDIGFYISLSGILTFKKATELQAIAKDVPLDRILVETDAPYLAPTPHRGKRNEPSYTRLTAEFLAELKGISYEEVARATTDNFFRLFSKATRPVV